jgi:hypothetical protein
LVGLSHLRSDGDGRRDLSARHPGKPLKGGLGIALIGGVGILVSANHRRIVFATFLVLLILFVMIGTLGNYFLTVYLALNLGSFSSEELISENIAEGTPDVTE